MKKQLTILVLIFAAAQCLFGAEAKPPAGAPLSDAQRIAYHLGQTPSVPVMLKWKTIFVLPASEKILDVVCGFKDDWDVYAPKDSNFAMVTPLKSQQVAHEPVVMASEIGGLPPYEFVLKQQDMLLRGRIARNNRQRQTEYVRRLIPELVIDEPISTEGELEEELAVPVDEDLVPIDPEPQPPKKRGGRPFRVTGPTLFDQPRDVSPME